MSVLWYVLHADGTYTPRPGFTGARTDEGVDFKIGNDTVHDPDGNEFYVSTVFLALDHQYGDGPPLVFETMIFPGRDGQIDSWLESWADRYTTIDQARDGHAKAIQMVRDGQIEGDA